jgi:hypothetical protein
MTPDQRVARYGADKGGIANQIDKRATEARAAKEASLIPRSDPTSAAFRAKDAEFSALGDRRRAEGSERALAQLRGSSITGSPDAFSAPKADPVFAQKGAVNQSPLVGITYNETAPDPWTTPPATGGGFTENSEKRMPAEMLNTLAALNSGASQGPRTPGIRQKIMNSIKRAPSNFAAAPRGQRRGAAAGAALLGATGLSGLIGGESERRQEGQY